MAAVKRTWFDEVERLESAYLDVGLDPDRAYELARQTANRTALQQKETDRWEH
jgi:pyrroline-5-carboxylate reductase